MSAQPPAAAGHGPAAAQVGDRDREQRRARPPGRARPGAPELPRASAHATALGLSLPAIPRPSGGTAPSNGRVCPRSPATRTASSTPAAAWTARRAGPRASWAASGRSASAPIGPRSGPATRARLPRGSRQVSATQAAPSTPKRSASPSEMFQSGKKLTAKANASAARGKREPGRGSGDREPERPPGRDRKAGPRRPTPSTARRRAAGASTRSRRRRGRELPRGSAGSRCSAWPGRRRRLRELWPRRSVASRAADGRAFGSG